MLSQSLPTLRENSMGKLKDLYAFGYTDPRGMFGLSPVKGEGMSTDYDIAQDVQQHTIEIEFEHEDGEDTNE
jgi:hypothetical protein